ncbi:trigger factor [Mycobacterium kubicae]|uniref:Trigger factor n=1 Tax=Mycobacterium kubicae TaxID=120959 RepID=A0AAX1J7G3_9MYCO|nr:trigger factor [Mycobacterium kubicae]MCV7094566.1 trigger factor [Mycobacterium kubicae]ORV97549.1 trigger factor [Mycobacterium kubicae]QNI12920.1 trigger factor [Mycobacterium kubicae]QPI36435.1 trigger factor [Mycobacterium kubicae]GFG67619.1 trigger factor [Mycobacterium kubicae]
MKSTVKQLSPTRVRINVEVPFTELEPDFQRAYKELAKQVRLPGFRPGKAPARLLEARFGREALLDQVIEEALPSRYGQAVTESDVQPIGRPNIQVTKKELGQDLEFFAEVDVRPKLELPDLDGLAVSVDPIEVTDEDVDAELQSLRARFGTLTGVDRPVQTGDFISIDLSATVDGEDVPAASAEGLSHEVGSGRLIAGLDDAVVGLSVDESKVFTAKLATGEHAGREAEVTVTVRSIKERELPEPDDEFAQLASEFDTIEELRENLRDQVRNAKRTQQAEQIRNATLDALVERVDVPLPEAIVRSQIDETLHTAMRGLDHDEAKFAEVLAQQGSSRAEFDAEARSAAENNVKRQLLLDAIADELDLEVSQEDLTERLVLTSRQYGIEPQQLFAYLQENNQLAAMFADVRRGLAVAAVVRKATVTDTDGNPIDVSEFFGDRSAESDELADSLDDADEVDEVDEVDEDSDDADDELDAADEAAEPQAEEADDAKS